MQAKIRVTQGTLLTSKPKTPVYIIWQAAMDSHHSWLTKNQYAVSSSAQDLIGIPMLLKYSLMSIWEYSLYKNVGNMPCQ